MTTDLENFKDFNPLKIFLEICKIPHKSFHTQPLKEWLIKEAQKRGARVASDKAGNLLFSKGVPKVCLQGHYDMVGVGAAERGWSIEVAYNPPFLSAKNSSLGADNGAAVACMLDLLEHSTHLECLITNDEEVGMIGARNLEVIPKAPYVINCDSEEAEEIVVGCAGGFDVVAQKKLQALQTPNNLDFYTLTSQGFKGGHSGIDIHKGIKSALLELAYYLFSFSCYLVSIQGGEKRNSIPAHCLATIATPKGVTPPNTQHFTQQKITPQTMPPIYAKEFILLPMLGIKTGVLDLNARGEVINSLNLGILNFKDGVLELHFMGRANENAMLRENRDFLSRVLEEQNFTLETADFYEAWDSQVGGKVSPLLTITQEFHQQFFKTTTLKTIHAGLECGILQQKIPHAQFISIGPTILQPHSVHERLDLESFKSFYEFLSKLSVCQNLF